MDFIEIIGAWEHNLKQVSVKIPKGTITVVTGVSGSGKSSLVFDTILREAQRRFFYTLSHYTRQFLDLGTKPKVKKILGLSPALGLAQNETNPSPRATVGTQTDLGELFGVLFARFGHRRCPKHGVPTESSFKNQTWFDELLKSHSNLHFFIGIPIAKEKKGHFRPIFAQYLKKGYLRGLVDGNIIHLSLPPDLDKNKKHTVLILVDTVKINLKSKDRILKSLKIAMKEGEGYGECFVAGENKELIKNITFSEKNGCPICGFSWPKLDPRYFSPNTLGGCKPCSGLGYMAEDPCTACAGTGLGEDYLGIRFQEKSIRDIYSLSINQLGGFLEDKGLNPALTQTIESIQLQIESLKNLNLGFLSLSRRLWTLSPGELQRLKLSHILSTSLRGLIYVLDEPSQGLHPSQIDHLWSVLKAIQATGSTLLIVDHDLSLMAGADLILDLGPAGGEKGGEILGLYPPKDWKKFTHRSPTARALGAITDFTFKPPVQNRSTLILKNAFLRNVQIPQVTFLKGALNAVTGVSGAGKSTLIFEILLKSKERLMAEEFSMEVINRKKVGKSHGSIIATYLDVFSEIRRLYGEVLEAQLLGLDASSFSLLNPKGARCQACEGRGFQILSMKFLSDAHIPCEICKQSRYDKKERDIRYKGLCLSQVLDLSVTQAIGHFSFYKKIKNRLIPAEKLGIGYLKLGQSLGSLSGGESQRLKLACALSNPSKKHRVYLMDEPTSGLHTEDIEKLLDQLELLTHLGATVIAIEHEPSLIFRSDWLVDLGPGAGPQGGQLIYEGPPSGILKVKKSLTGQYLKKRHRLDRSAPPIP
jgi:excinuclease ABC subunit A